MADTTVNVQEQNTQVNVTGAIIDAGASGVTSFNTRTGAVTSQTGDYTHAQTSNRDAVDSHPDSAISSPVGYDASGDNGALVYSDARRDMYNDLGSASTHTISSVTGISYGDDFRYWLKTSNADLTLTLPTSTTNISGALTANSVWILLIITADPAGGLRILSTAEAS